MYIRGIGDIPMMFYIPDQRARDKITEKIEQHGGIVVDHYDAYVYQIKPTRGLRSGSMSNVEQFYVGYVYNSQWLTDSIKKKKLIDEEKYLCGFNKTSKLSIIKKNEKRPYTVSEVVKIFDLVEEYGGSIKKVPPMKFWQEIDAKNYIPDRSGASMRTAFRKFAVGTRKAFVKAAYKKASSRFSHQFEDTPDFVTVSHPSPKKKKDSCVRNLDNIMNSASTKVSTINSWSKKTSNQNSASKKIRNLKVEPIEPLETLEELSPELTPQVDLNVLTNPPSLLGDDEDMEFVLEVEDMQSAISNHFAQDSSYNIKPTRKRHRMENLDQIFTSHDQGVGHKRMKVNEVESKEYTECDTTIYDQDSLMEHITTDAKIRITSSLSSGERTVESKLNNGDTYFQKITEELDNLCIEYEISMDEMHALFMGAWWDMEDLKKILINNKRNQTEWSHLEDIAASSDPGSEEYNYVVTTKGENAVSKRRNFLEIRKES
jgi:hypothetical protein